MDKIYIFTGPSCLKSDLQILQSEASFVRFLPPVARGDLLGLVSSLETSATILVIDGYFTQNLSVWHNEFLYAAKHNHKVFGCSSMGALRAAELKGYGVKGLGRIYNYFQSSTTSFDDEVALAHASADLDYRAASYPIVNLRISGEDMVSDKVITSEQLNLLISIGRSFPYYERQVKTILSIYRKSCGLTVESEIDLHISHIQSRLKDIKRLDALASIASLAQLSPEQIGKVDSQLPNYIASNLDLFDISWMQSDSYFPSDNTEQTNLPFETFKIREFKSSYSSSKPKISGSDIRDYILLAEQSHENSLLKDSYLRSLAIQLLKVLGWASDKETAHNIQAKLMSKYQACDTNSLCQKLLIDQEQLRALIDDEAILQIALQNHVFRHWINSSVGNLCDYLRIKGSFVGTIENTINFLRQNNNEIPINSDDACKRILKSEELQKLTSDADIKLNGFVDPDDLERTLKNYLLPLQQSESNSYL